jgi:hypothetical protein
MPKRAHTAGALAAVAAVAATPAFAAPPQALPTTPTMTPIPDPPPEPAADGGHRQRHEPSHRHAPRPHRKQQKRKPKREHKDPRPSAAPFADLPGPGVPAIAVERFRIPVFLLPIYQAAGIQYGVRWELLAAINEVESDYGRNMGVSSAGAVGWMQFIPSTWRAWGVDGNGDGSRDPYNPVDAIFSAARYLRAAGAASDERTAVFAYNHADWYVDDVLLRARLIESYPPQMVAALTGLSDGRFPVAARARYSARGRRTVAAVYSRRRAPVVAVNDAVVRKVGSSRRKGRYLVLEDVYGNTYQYGKLGSVARVYPVPRPARAAPQAPPARPAPAPRLVRERVFAHPRRPQARRHGGLEQMLDAGATQYNHVFAPALGLDAKHATLRTLEPGSHVVAGTVIGHTRAQRRLPMSFAIRPAGRRAPMIDPRPILDGWTLLESTAIYDTSGRDALLGRHSVGQVLLMPKTVLEKRVLRDRRVTIYPQGRRDIRTGQIDRRVLATLEFLAQSGLDPTVSSLRAGHSRLTTSGNVSEHYSGDAVDVSAVNGVPIAGHQEPGGIADQTVRRLMLLQGTVAPHQIISLLDLGANTMALPDHADHIHIGFRPVLGLGAASLRPGQWVALLRRLGALQQPRVPTARSRFAVR